jgi:putative transposase
MQDPEDTRTVIARFRYSVIAPLVVRPLDKGEQAHLIADLASRLWPAPDGSTIHIHRRTLTRWLARYRLRGFSGLMPEPRTDRGARLRLADDIVARAAELRKEDPRRSVKTLIRILELEGLAPPGTVKRTTLSHALCRMGVSRAEVARPTQTFQRRESAYPNQMWQADTQIALHMPDAQGRRRPVYLIAAIDDHSRHVVAHYYWRDNRPSLEDLLKRAILLRGKPEILYCDNGANWRSHMLETACATLAIDLRHARPYRPQGKGKIERWFKTADSFNHEAQALIDHGSLGTLDQLQQFFSAWLEGEYNSRVHSSTHETPNARLARTDPQHPVVRIDLDVLNQAFLWTEKRKVTAVATISVQGNDYQVDPGLARRTITVRYDPYDLSRIRVEFSGQTFPDATPLVLRHDTSPELPPKSDGEAQPAAPQTAFLALVQDHEDKARRERLGQTRFAKTTADAGGEVDK